MNLNLFKKLKKNWIILIYAQFLMIMVLCKWDEDGKTFAIF
jgi:hypothetical protein